MKNILIRLLFIGLLIFGMLYVVGCTSPEIQKQQDAQKEFCGFVDSYRPEFINENPNLTDLQKTTTSLLLDCAVKPVEEDEKEQTQTKEAE